MEDDKTQPLQHDQLYRGDIRIEATKQSSDDSQRRATAEKEKQESHFLETAKQKLFDAERKAAENLKEVAHIARDAIAAPDAPYGPPGYVSPDPDRYGHLTEEEKLHLLENKRKYFYETTSREAAAYDMSDPSSSPIIIASTSSIPLWRTESDSQPETSASYVKYHERVSSDVATGPETRRSDAVPYVRGATASVPLWRADGDAYSREAREGVRQTLSDSSAPYSDEVRGFEVPYGHAATTTIPLWRAGTSDTADTSAREYASALAAKAREDFEKLSQKASQKSKDSSIYPEEIAREKGSDLSHRAADKVSRAGNNIQDKGSQADETIRDTGRNIAEKTEHAASAAKGAVKQSGHQIPDSAAKAKDYIRDKADLAVDTVAEKARGADETVRDKGQYANERVQSEASRAKEITKEKAALVRDKSIEYGHRVADKATDVKEAVSDKASEATEAARQKFYQAEDSLLDKTMHATEYVADKAQMAEETLVGTAKYAGEQIKEKVIHAKDSVVDSVYDAGKAVEGATRHTVEKAKEVKDAITGTVEKRASEAKHKAQDFGDRAVHFERKAVQKVGDLTEKGKSKVHDAEDRLALVRDDAKEVAKETLHTGKEAIESTATRTEEYAAKVIGEGKKLKDAAQSRIADVTREATNATSSVIGVAAEKVGEIRSASRAEKEKQLASELERPMEDRVEHANLALQYELEQREHARRKEEYEKYLAETRVAQAVSQTLEQAKPVANGAAQKVAEFGDKISQQAGEIKKRYEDKREELQRRAHDQMLHGSHPVSDAAYSTLDTARAVRRYVEDTGEWMKAGVRYMRTEINDRLESVSGVMTEGSKEIKHATRAQIEHFKAQSAPNEMKAAKHAERARREEEERSIHHANKEQHWENLTYMGKVKQRVSRFLFGKQAQPEQH